MNLKPLDEVLHARGKMNLPPSEQEWLKIADDCVGKIRQTIKCFKNRLTIDNPRLSERYINAELEPLVRLAVISLRGDRQEFVVLYQRVSGSYIEVYVPTKWKFKPPTVEHSSYSDNEPMLVHTVECMDMPERIIPSYVRLYRAEDFFRARVHLVYFSLADGRCVMLGGLADRKVSLMVRSSTASVNKLTDEMVERTSQVVDSVSDDKRNIGGDRLETGDVQHYLRKQLRMLLDAKSIRLSIAEGADSNIQITDVLFGPFNFEPDFVDSTHTQAGVYL